MPRVPTAEGLGVLPTIRSGGARPVLSVEQAAMPGRQMQERGAQMMQIGAQIGDYAQQQQERINRARVQDAYVQAQNFERELYLEQRQLTGQAAVGSTEAFAERYSKRLSELSQDLSPIAQEAFRAKADALYGGFLDRGTKYEADQFDAYEASVLDSTIVSATQNMQVFKDDREEFARNREESREAFRMKADRAGLSGAAAEQFVQAEMGKTHAIIIDNMLNAGDPRSADAYFAQVEDDFLPTQAQAMRNRIDGGLKPAEASAMVDALLAEIPMEGLNIPRSDMDAWLRSKISDPATQTAARQELNLRIAAHEEQYRNEQAEAYDTALQLAATRGIAAASGTAAWQSLGAKDQLAIRDYIETRTETMRAREAAGVAREKSKTQQAQDMAYYDIIHTQAGLTALAARTRGELFALRPTVGEGNFARLVQLHADLNAGPERVYEVTLDNNTFNGIAQRYGYDPLSDNEDDKRELLELRLQLQSAIVAEQNRIGKLDPDQKRKVMENVFAESKATSYVPVRGGMFGGISLKRAVDLTPDQINRIRVEDIPYEERLRIVQALGDDFNVTGDPQTDPTNPNNIRAMYLAMRGVGVQND